MRSTKWLLASFITFSAVAQTLPKFATKQTLENIRFISNDGKTSYVQKRSGGLSLVSSFNTTDMVERPAGTNYHITSSPARRRVVIEVERSWHQEMDLTKNHDILVANMGNPKSTNVGRGRHARLQLDDEWLTWFDPKEKVIHVQLLAVKERHYIIRLGKKHNPFFFPEVVMLNPETVLYTDINDKGHAALLSFNLLSSQMTVVKKAETAGTRMEICRRGTYLALGEFSYDDTNRGSSIHVMAWKGAPMMGGFANLYLTSDNDLGQIVCGDNQIWFVKTVSEDRKWNLRVTEAASLNLATNKVEFKTALGRVSQLVEMDGRVFVPFREEIFVLHGDPGSAKDQLTRPAGETP